jgi:hypothetical protein
MPQPQKKKAVMTVTATDVKVQSNLYRGMNNTPAGEAKVTVSAWADTDLDHVPNLSMYDIDITEHLTPEELAHVVAVLDICERFAEKTWGIE